MAKGKLQLAMPMDKVKELSNMSLMVSYLLESQFYRSVNSLSINIFIDCLFGFVFMFSVLSFPFLCFHCQKILKSQKLDCFHFPSTKKFLRILLFSRNGPVL